VAVVLGLWIALVPFTRPLPGSTTFSLEATPEVNCRTPVIGMLGDDQPTVEVYTTPRPQAGDPTEPRTVDCTGRARFRIVLGASMLIVGLLGPGIARRRTVDRP